MGGIDSETGQIFQYQKGEIVLLSDVAVKSLGTNVKVIDSENSETLNKLNKAQSVVENQRTEILEKIENRIDKTVTRKRKRK